MRVAFMVAVLLVERACGGWINPSLPGFTADETALRIDGDRTNAAALAAETAARAGFDGQLQVTNGLVLYGQDLYRQTFVDGPVGWLDWVVSGVDGQTTVGVWAHWEGVILNSDGTVDDDQVPDFGASDIGPYAWILDPDGNYRVPQEWQDGDYFGNVGPDYAAACTWSGWGWSAGETTVGDTVIDAVVTGYAGSDTIGSYDDNAQCAVTWQVSADGKLVSYTINWQPSVGAPSGPPWYVYAEPVSATVKIRPAAELALVSDGAVAGDICAPDGTPAWWIGYGPFDPPIEMRGGAYFAYEFTDEYPGTSGATPIDLNQQWLYGFERDYCWVEVPSALEVTNTVNGAIAGDQTRYLKGDVDSLLQGVRDDLGGQVEAVRGDLGAAVAASTNLLAPALAGMFQSAAVTADSNRVVTLAWSNTPFVTVQNTNAIFLALPPLPATGQAESVFFDCTGTNALLFTTPVLWASAPPSGRGLYQLYGNSLATNAWRGWAVPETRAAVAYTQFVYALPPQGPISNGLFASPVGVTLGNGATSNGLPATVAVLCREQTQTNWTALTLARTNLYAGDLYLPFGSLRVAFSNAADAAVSAMPAFAVNSSYFLEPGQGLVRGYPAWDSGAWFNGGTTADGAWSGGGSFFTTGGSVAPGFTRGSYRTGAWGYGDADGCLRSPAVTGLITRVRLMVRLAIGGIQGVVEYCPLTADWNQSSSWVAVPGGTITSTDWNWLMLPVNLTNGYFRIRNTPIILNTPTLNIAYVAIE